MGHMRHRSLTTMRSYVRRAKLSQGRCHFSGADLCNNADAEEFALLPVRAACRATYAVSGTLSAEMHRKSSGSVTRRRYEVQPAAASFGEFPFARLGGKCAGVQTAILACMLSGSSWVIRGAGCPGGWIL
jgi:hypothetical protein